MMEDIRLLGGPLNGSASGPRVAMLRRVDPPYFCSNIGSWHHYRRLDPSTYEWAGPCEGQEHPLGWPHTHDEENR